MAPKLPKESPTSTLVKKYGKPKPGTKKTSQGVVGGPVYGGSRTGGVTRMQRRRQK